ncbi:MULTISPECIES: NCS2 family permease [Clostridium]|uniref:Guanine-hypoxanthine permease n=1 Tax=Clostridium novyi (strain NT) TaxID=386415 RepID=A0Q1I8_CLONN|nr:MULTISPECIES: NCS2 family permease [Clostridium]ABK61531.1 guanine-hypoxanthine permease [Clostridium novyi NT]KEH88214.1 guanine permease [Clostridium novyi A str. NCTC 538]KEH89416.1 guanine permease [Clostridium novyi A str. 4540]KEH91336.1 guanine permease [Clostridium novyi A str. BKT29909]KEH94202.1 guanine permease [Clostridium botulinum C/D str. It1]
MENSKKRKDNLKESFLDKYFKLSENGTSVRTEILAGLTAFITMAYALLVIPNMLKFSGMNSLGVKGDAAASLTVLNDPVISSAFAGMCIASCIGTLIMALYANLPFALAPGMGLTAFFTYSVCLTLGYTWQQALTAVFISGILFIIITVTSIREKIVEALPQNLKLAITGGIGLFVSLIGLKSGHIVVSDPGTLVKFGDLTSKSTVLTVIGIIVMAILMARNVRGGMLISIILTTIIGIPMGITKISGLKFFSVPKFGATFFAFDFKGLLHHGGSGFVGALTSIVMVILTFSLVDLFDTIGTLVGTAHKADMIQPDGKVKNMRKALLSDAVATTISSMMGTPTMATVVESTAGIAEGGRTGLTNVVVGILFALSLFFGGIVGIVPSEATAPALIIVGILMVGAVKEIDFEDFTEALPAFFTMAMMPFTYSIANGIAAGIIFYTVIKLGTGKQKQIHPIMYILSLLFILRFVLLPQ